MSEQHDNTDPRPLTTDQKRLVEEHHQVASWTARRYFRRIHGTIPLDDLLSEAHWGLVWGALTFDPDLRVPFGAYARITIRSRLKIFLRDYFRQRRRRVISLSRCRIDLPNKYDDEMDREERNQKIEFVRRALPERWFKLLYLHFVEGMRVSRIARNMGITNQRANQILKAAINLLHEAKSFRSKRLLRLLNLERQRAAKELRK